MFECEYILERVGPIKEEVIIDQPFFRCGRMKECNLICLSVLVSREHCMFTKTPNDLYVTDLQSSNGVYVNGELIRPGREIKLNENDLVGIGCCDVNNLDEFMFIYKVKFRRNTEHTERENSKYYCKELL